ncbi:MAG TPA: hypothetical protein VFZ00_08440, partial [Solirubrobacter sp.]|nr:hypothetical protein [Solirubrobacter sp.]
GAPELSRAPFAELLAAVEAWSPREDTLQAYLATPGVDGKRLALADTIVMRKESGADEAAVIEIAQELYILGTPVADRDAVFTYLGFGGLALPSSIEAFASASTAAAAAIATMNTFAERAAAVRGVINARLTAVGVPPVGPITAEGGGNAHFKKQDWTVSVDPDFAMRGGPSAPGELLTAVYTRRATPSRTFSSRGTWRATATRRRSPPSTRCRSRSPRPRRRRRCRLMIRRPNWPSACAARSPTPDRIPSSRRSARG